VLGFNKDID
jgi:WD40 repeat protein